MNTLLIFLVQSKSAAALEIIAMLSGAAIIGYITAWLYSRSVYTKRIAVIDSEKHELNNRIINLNGKIVEMDRSLERKGKEIDRLILDNLAHRKHLLNYLSFGTATESEKDDLKMISGIGPYIEEGLNALDIYTLRQISKFNAEDIVAIDSAIIYFSGRIDRDKWVDQAIDIVHNKDIRTELFKRISERKSSIHYNRIGIAHKDKADDLTEITGIGGWIQEKLNVLDVYTFRQISNFTEEDINTVSEAIEFFPGRIERDEWVLQAHDLVRIAGNKSELLKRIRDRHGKIYFDRLGTAHKHEANNLTLIDGLGLWVEERLNLLGIYTFDQISNLTQEDIETITEVLEIIPGRIKKDNWVGQARELAKKQPVPKKSVLYQ